MDYEMQGYSGKTATDYNVNQTCSNIITSAEAAAGCKTYNNGVGYDLLSAVYAADEGVLFVCFGCIIHALAPVEDENKPHIQLLYWDGNVNDRYGEESESRAVELNFTKKDVIPMG